MHPRYRVVHTPEQPAYPPSYFPVMRELFGREADAHQLAVRSAVIDLTPDRTGNRA